MRGGVGGRKVKISHNCSRDTGGVVNYYPPRKTGADRGSHKQQLRIQITFGTTRPWSFHSHTTPSKSGSSTRAVPLDPARTHHKHARGPAYHLAEGPLSRRKTHRCDWLAFLGPPGQLVTELLSPPRPVALSALIGPRPFTAIQPLANPVVAHVRAHGSSGSAPNAKHATGTRLPPYLVDSVGLPAEIPLKCNADPPPAHTASSE